MLAILVVLLFTIVSSQTIVPVPSNTFASVNQTHQSQTYAISIPTGTGQFQITLWRTNVVDYQTASVSLTLRNPLNVIQNFTGDFTGTGNTPGYYNLTIFNRGSSNYAYRLQVCNSFCSGGSGCHFSSSKGYCNNNGACISSPSSSCKCDNVTNVSNIILDSFDCAASDFTPLTDLFLSLLGVWIAVIVIGFILVFIVPIIICCCCCGLCAAAAVSHETAPIVHHHHNYSHH